MIWGTERNMPIKSRPIKISSLLNQLNGVRNNMRFAEIRNDYFYSYLVR